MQRSGKWYRNNEADVMKSLGLEPTPNSGSGWVVKEDGQNDSLICQLKSTDASSIRIDWLDVDKLFCNAAIAHKVPVFAVQFIKAGEIFLLVRPNDLQDVSDVITGSYKRSDDELLIDDCQSALESTTGPSKREVKVIKSGGNGRIEVMEENERKYEKERKDAR